MSFLMQLQDVEAAGRLAPFSAAFRAGEIVHLVGPNGAGKSTLLTRMAGLSDGPGTVHFNGRLLDEWPARELARRRGYLSQHQTPPFAMPVWHYLALHMQQQGDSARLSDIAARLGLDNKLGRPVNQLSGGEWQRVRLAAVILQIDPLSNSAGQLLLLDEPMNSLDVAQPGGAGSAVTRAERGGDCGGDEQPRSQPYPAPRRSELAALPGGSHRLAGRPPRC